MTSRRAFENPVQDCAFESMAEFVPVGSATEDDVDCHARGDRAKSARGIGIRDIRHVHGGQDKTRFGIWHSARRPVIDHLRFAETHKHGE